MQVYKNKKDLIESLIRPEDVVLDVGFWGQGVTVDDQNWPHKLLKHRARDAYGLDLVFDTNKFSQEKYFEASAEDFLISTTFDSIFAGDLIEHLSNPGLFLGNSKKHLKPDGRLIITTPNCFSLFNLTEKITKYEPTVNKDHTCYFNHKTISQLLGKNGLSVESAGYLYSLDVEFKESWKKKVLNILYKFISIFTPKYLETIVVVAKVK